MSTSPSPAIISASISRLRSLRVGFLSLTDAAPFASNADKNPTLSITALGWRTSDYIADQIKKRNL